MNNNIGHPQFSPPSNATTSINDQKQSTSNQQTTPSRLTLPNIINISGIGEKILSYAPETANELRRMEDMRIPGRIGLARSPITPDTHTVTDLECHSDYDCPAELQPSSNIGSRNNHTIAGLQCDPIRISSIFGIILDYSSFT